MFRNRLTKVFRHLAKQSKRLNISCYRVYDHDLSEFPFCIELYDDKLYVAEYKRRHGMMEEEHEEWLRKCKEIMSEIVLVPAENIFLKQRQRKAGRKGQYQKTSDTRSEFVTEENGLKFIINLSDYLDTGLFLDHRLTRQMVRDESKEKKVLNLFAYTGSFSVYAAAGGASEVVSVDMSNTYLGWAKKNMLLNGFTDKNKYSYIQADVLKYINEIRENYFDLMILDPPTFSNSKRMDDFFDIQRDHVKLINDCIRGLKNSGILYFSTNYSKFNLDIKNIQSTFLTDISKQTTPFDFAGKLNRMCFRIIK